MFGAHQRAKQHTARNLAMLTSALVSSAAVAATALAPAAHADFYPLTGRAYGLGISNISILGIPVPPGASPDTGLVQTWDSTDTKPACGDIPAGYVTSSQLCAEVVTDQDDQSVDSTASVATAHVGIPGLPVIDIKAVKAEAKAGCFEDPTASTTIDYLKVGGTVVIAQRTAVRPNTVVNVGVVKLILNEQSTSQGDGNSSSQVDAVHIQANVLGLVTADVVVNSAQAAATCWAS